MSITKNFGGFWDEFDRRVHGYIINVVRRYERIIQESFRAPKHGRIYRIGSTPTKADKTAGRTVRTYQASAPGEAPAIRFGRLRQSITHVIEKLGPAHYRATIGPSVKDYPEFLEYGTSGMEPHPVWRPALEQLRDEESSK